MIAYGVCIEDPEVFEARCVPSIKACAGDDALLLTSRERPATALNQILTAVASMPEVEALVILHDGTGLSPDCQESGILDWARSPASSIVVPEITDFGFLMALSAAACANLRCDPAIDSLEEALMSLCRQASESGYSLDLGLNLSKNSIPDFVPHQDGALGVEDQRIERRSYYSHTRTELLEHIPRSARRLLDVGCGEGKTAAAARLMYPGLEVSGLEFAEEVIPIAAMKLDRIIRADLNSVTELPVAPGYFDVMIFADVLEHLLDPERTLLNLLPYLATDGLIIVSVPNVKHWSVLAPLLASDRFEYTDAGLLDRTHVHFFTLHEAHSMLLRVGLTELVAASRVEMLPTHADLVSPLISAAEAYGVDKSEAEQLFNAYQYIFAVRRPLVYSISNDGRP